MNSIIKLMENYEYDPSLCVGEWALGKKYKGLNIKTREVVAIKQMEGFLKGDQYISETLKKEIQMLRKNKSPNIVRVIDFFETQNNYYLITEYCDSGDLKEYMKNHKQGVPEQEAQIIFTDIVDGLNAMQKENVIHGDLKPANILKCQNRYKIADFGFGAILQQIWFGSPLYQAPQILMRQIFGAKCDLWSLGVMYYQILTGRPPFIGVNESDLLSNIKEYQFKPLINISSLSNKFLEKALVFDESKRIEFEETFAVFNEFKKLVNVALVSGPNLESCVLVKPINLEIQQDLQNDCQKKFRIYQLRITEQFLAFIIFVIYETFSQYRICNKFQEENLEIVTLLYMIAKYIEVQYIKALKTTKGLEDEYYQLIKQQSDYFGELLKDLENHMNILGIFKQVLDKDEIKQFLISKDLNKLSQSIDQYILRLVSNFRKKYSKSIVQEYNLIKENEKYLIQKYLQILYYLLKIVELKRQVENNNQHRMDISQYHQFKEKDIRKALGILIDLEKFLLY